jgi:hypothetical protein
MDRRLFLGSLAAGAASSLLPTPAAAQKKKDTALESAIDRALEGIKKLQNTDGHWESPGGYYPTCVTALAGMAMLMEGSNLREGKYSDQLQKAVGWFLNPARTRANGLLGNVDSPSESARYMYGHGFGAMFLASVYGEEEDRDQRKKLETVITKAIDFTAKSQTSKKHRLAEGKTLDIGGWGYTSAADSGGAGGFDEGSCTVPQIQALRAARNAGIKVPKETIDKADAYLDACTTTDGGIVYNYTGGNQAGGGRPALTAAALACGLGTGKFTEAIRIMTGKNPPKGVERPSIVRWFEHCKKTIPIGKGRSAHEEYQMYYYAQGMYALGDDRYAMLFPGEAKETHLTWTKFKEALFPTILESQDKTTGVWNGGGSWNMGSTLASAMNLCILQLDKGILPIYQR